MIIGHETTDDWICLCSQFRAREVLNLDVLIPILDVVGAGHMDGTWEFVIRIVIILNLHRSLDDTTIDENITKLEILHGDFITVLKLHECFGGETPAATTPTAAALASLTSLASLASLTFLGSSFFLVEKKCRCTGG